MSKFIMKMYKYKWNFDLAYATSRERTVTVNKGKTIYKGKRRQKTDVKCQKTRRRKKTFEDKETMQKELKSPNIHSLNTINIMNIEWRLQDEEKRKGNWVC